MMYINTMRILVTENCNARCPHCFNSFYREKKEIDIKTYIKLCYYLSSNNISRVKIMGGEPTVHSSFREIIKISQSYFDSVIVFTNAMNERITDMHPRDDDAIVYNFKFISTHFKKKKFLLDQPGRSRLEIQIGIKTNVENIMNRLYFYKDIIHNMKINLTLDCMENIFEHKLLLQDKFGVISRFITEELGVSYYVDHIIPSCLFSEHIDTPDALCSIKCAGLIDSSLRLRFCNQHESPLCSIVLPQGGFIPFNELVSNIESAFNSKIDIIRSKKCKNCSLFQIKCNGGCFAHKYL